MLVIGSNRRKPPLATPSPVFEPFSLKDSPAFANGTPIRGAREEEGRIASFERHEKHWTLNSDLVLGR